VPGLGASIGMFALSAREGSMSESTVIARRWMQDTDAAEVSQSFYAVCLFSLVGIALSVAVLVLASNEAITSITIALTG
jgi:hypothetical protein